MKDWYASMPEELRAQFREYSTRRRRKDATCAICGAELRDVVNKRTYCSNACRQRAKRQRAREAPAGRS